MVVDVCTSHSHKFFFSYFYLSNYFPVCVWVFRVVCCVFFVFAFSACNSNWLDFPAQLFPTKQKKRRRTKEKLPKQKLNSNQFSLDTIKKSRVIVDRRETFTDSVSLAGNNVAGKSFHRQSHQSEEKFSSRSVVRSVSEKRLKIKINSNRNSSFPQRPSTWSWAVPWKKMKKSSEHFLAKNEHSVIVDVDYIHKFLVTCYQILLLVLVSSLVDSF